MWTVGRLAADLAAGKASSRELVEQALARIADANGEGARAFVKTYAETARAEAALADRLRAAGIVRSPVDGLPVSVKDLFDVGGDVTRAGSKLLAGAAPAERDAPAVARLRAAGAVIVGRTNMVEFAFGTTGINPHYGTPRNPWDRKTGRIPGGSSSGAAVGQADGMSVMALGSDTRGSIRQPAALCGVAGFKPTQQRVSRDGAFTPQQAFATGKPIVLIQNGIHAGEIKLRRFAALLEPGQVGIIDRSLDVFRQVEKLFHCAERNQIGVSREPAYVERPQMSRETVERRVLPKQHLGAVGHVLVPKVARAHRMEHDRGSPAGHLVINPHGTAVPVCLGRLVRGRLSQTRKRQDRHRFSDDGPKVLLDMVLSQLGHWQVSCK